jgi:Tol biopolymer transport system component
MLVQLRWIAEGGRAPGSPPVAKREKRLRIALAVALLLIVALAYPAARYWLGSTEPEPFQFRVPVNSPRGGTISPDGKTIALIATPSTGEPNALYRRPIDSVTSKKLMGTDNADQAFWSPDGRSIGFVASGRLKQVSVDGGAPKDICEVQGFKGGAWNQEGTILFGSAKGVFRISEGGKALAVTTLDAQETGHFWPSFLPDGQHFLYLAWSGEAGNRAVFIGKLDSKEKTKLMTGESNAVYAAPGHIVFQREGSVLARPFDVGKLELSGKEMHIADDAKFPSTDGNSSFDVSQTGTLLYYQAATPVAIQGRGNVIQNLQLGWADRSGNLLGLAGEPGPYGDWDLSPDEKLIAVTKQEAGSPNADIWVIDLQRAGIESSLTQGPADNINPIWSPDGKHLAFTSYRKGNADIYAIEYGSGISKEIPLLESANDEIVKEWSKDGMGEVYRATDARLDRVVAIKLLTRHWDTEMRQRFEREAQIIASLNHPNICVLHDIGRQDDIDFLVMEYLEGETLSARLARKALELDEAHRSGVVRRDLKPSNIILTATGPKLLDFGLAKRRADLSGSGANQPGDRTGSPSPAPSPSEAQTQSNLTSPGVILGTLQYMAPEQLEGLEADARTDIFAFGSMLHEMLTGKKAFEGASRILLISAIATAEPKPVSSMQAAAPPALDKHI